MIFTQTYEDEFVASIEDDRPDPSMLVDQNDLMRLAAEHNPDVTGVVDPDGTFRYAAGDTVALIGMQAAEAVGMKIWEFVHPDDLDSAAGALNEASRVSGRHLPTVFRVRHLADSWVECEVKGTTFDGPGGSWMILAVRGIANRNQLMDRRRALEQLIRRASTECSAVSWQEADDVVSGFLGQLAGVVNARSVLLAWESRGQMEVAARWPDHQVVLPGVPFESVWPMEETASSLLKFSSDLESEPESAIRNTLIASGARAAVEVALSAGEPWRMLRIAFDDDWRQWDDANIDLVKVLTMTLLSTLGRCWAEKSLQVQATTDALTGLMNRTELYRVLDLCLGDRRGQGTVAVLYGDLNHFKQVNDVEGHGAGDSLLIEVAEALRSSVRAVDVLARVGGDEFVIVCPDIEDDGQLDNIVRRIETTVASLGTEDRPVSISVGRAVSGSCRTGDQLISEADEDMYRVKRASGGREAMGRQVHGR